METLNKPAPATQLITSFTDVKNWIAEQPVDRFNVEIVEGKWTIAGHLYHLVKTAKAVQKGMATPKLALRTLFGKSNRTERTYDGLREKYKNALRATNVQAPADYSPANGRTFERHELLGRFEQLLTDQIATLDRWTEEELSTYIMPHPALGKCTLREFCYFLIVHNYHHLDILRGQYATSTQ